MRSLFMNAQVEQDQEDIPEGVVGGGEGGGLEEERGDV